ncbi:MAG: hypothetical protein RLZZ628_4370 [Bacteroidota bacterium]|jgi:hypothetical protein
MKHFLRWTKNPARPFIRVCLLTLCFCAPFFAWGQLDKLAVQLGTIDPVEVDIAQNALTNLTKTDYVYLVVYSSNDKDKFALYTSGKIRPIAPEKVAALILPQIDPSKNVVLLSSASAAATQELADVLGAEDIKAKRKVRQVIGWEEDVLLYKNGAFKGYGKCFSYELKKTPQELLNNIPTGSNFVTGTDFIALSQSPNTLREWLRDWTPIETKDKVMESVKGIKTRNITLYNTLVQNKRCFMKGWRYLWELEYESYLRADINFLCQVATIQEQYTRNKTLKPDSMAAYHASFVDFLKNGTKKEYTDQLTVTGLLPYQFEAIVEASVNSMTLEEFLKEKTGVSTPFGKQIAVIGSSELNLQKELMATNSETLPKVLWTALRKTLTDKDYIKEITTLRDARIKLIGMINERIGQDPEINFQKLINLTVTTKWIQNYVSWGSLFENWMEKRYFVAATSPDIKTVNAFVIKDDEGTLLDEKKKVNQGKATFYFEIGNGNSIPVSKATDAAIAAAQSKVDAAKTVTDKKIATDALSFLLKSLKTRTLDASYLEKNTDAELKEAKTKDLEPRSELVVVELKHIQGRLEGEPLERLKDHAKLVATNKVRRIEYIFSTETAAKENQIHFQTYFIKSVIGQAPVPLRKGNDYEIYFINLKGVKTPFNFK